MVKQDDELARERRSPLCIVPVTLVAPHEQDALAMARADAGR
jgi:hypothetical protein